MCSAYVTPFPVWLIGWNIRSTDRYIHHLFLTILFFQLEHEQHSNCTNISRTNNVILAVYTCMEGCCGKILNSYGRLRFILFTHLESLAAAIFISHHFHLILIVPVHHPHHPGPQPLQPKEFFHLHLREYVVYFLFFK